MNRAVAIDVGLQSVSQFRRQRRPLSRLFGADHGRLVRLSGRLDRDRDAGRALDDVVVRENESIGRHDHARPGRMFLRGVVEHGIDRHDADLLRRG